MMYGVYNVPATYAGLGLFQEEKDELMCGESRWRTAARSGKTIGEGRMKRLCVCMSRCVQVSPANRLKRHGVTATQWGPWMERQRMLMCVRREGGTVSLPHVVGLSLIGTRGKEKVQW